MVCGFVLTYVSTKLFPNQVNICNSSAKYVKSETTFLPWSCIRMSIKQETILWAWYFPLIIQYNRMRKLTNLGQTENQRSYQYKKYHLTRIGIPIIKISRSYDRLIFIVEISIHGKEWLYIEQRILLSFTVFSIWPHWCIYGSQKLVVQWLRK